ncbi:3'-5' exonuclease [Marinospirillum alkaliphilum]|uniref:DNA polymerase-3 subunit epsilon n=1 Tax=Marinospirillum alkaliphilum DSM 21637 TaxID=1122209 RepID=A0A1K1VGD0_9GAMM|nr:3'-5' exonuclease [Marinospirillum alkaliphilum]SFX23772.1 DNA polymerase-3 subunit epsilon [Marinospirillum alkaliphilum DSM 21637]
MVLKTIRTATDRWTHKDGEFAYMFEPYEGDEVVALDCEMTSLDPQKAELVSIAAVKIKGTQVLTSDKLDIKLQKPESLTGDSIKVHRIRGVDLLGGEVLGDALRQLLEFVGNRPIMGYYINYDITVLNRFIRPRFGFSLPNRTIELSNCYLDKVQRANPELVPDLQFETIAGKLGVPMVGQRHTALGDAITTALMYVRLLKGPVPA